MYRNDEEKTSHNWLLWAFAMWWSAQGYIGEMINESSLFLALFLPHNILKHWFIVELNIEAVKGFGHAYPIRPGVGATALASAVRVEYDSVPMKLLNTVDDRVVQIMMMKRRRREAGAAANAASGECDDVVGELSRDLLYSTL